MISRVAAVPAGASSLAHGILAEGEATGHHHRIEDLETAELLSCADGMFLRVGPAGARIVHEEHAAIHLGSGSYNVVRQSEYRPEAVRNVAD